VATLTHPKGQTIEVPAEKVEYFTKLGWTEIGEAPATEPETVTIPEGEPSEDWTLKQLAAFAESKSVDLTGVKNSKKAFIEAIAGQKPSE
jgi:hypothetical protein